MCVQVFVLVQVFVCEHVCEHVFLCVSMCVSMCVRRACMYLAKRSCFLPSLSTAAMATPVPGRAKTSVRK